jgi:CHASE2 domain-containing sensor protein
MINKGVIFDSILGTAFLLSLILLFQFVRFFGEFSLLDPVGDAIGDVEMTDLVFSNLRETPKPDKNVVLVNIGNLSRRDIARELMIINKYEPAVVGVDSYFWELKEDSLGDILLNWALSDIENLVMINKLLYSESSKSYSDIRNSHPFFNIGDCGYANLETDALDQYQFKVCRSFPPIMSVDGKNELSFGVKVVEAYDSEKASAFLKRKHDYEIINYRGNIIGFDQTEFGGRFIALDVDDVFEERFLPEVIKDKIVLFGYMGADFNDRSWEDKFFTPLNINYAGRSNPDMFGVVIHANIISMILNEDYIGKQSELAGIITALIICFLTVILFTIIYKRLPQWYDGLTKSLQLIFVLMLLTINVFAFHWFNYKTNLTLATILVALSGDGLEIFYGLVKNIFSRGGRQLIFKVYNYK